MNCDARGACRAWRPRGMVDTGLARGSGIQLLHSGSGPFGGTVSCGAPADMPFGRQSVLSRLCFASGGVVRILSRFPQVLGLQCPANAGVESFSIAAAISRVIGSKESVLMGSSPVRTMRMETSESTLNSSALALPHRAARGAEPNDRCASNCSEEHVLLRVVPHRAHLLSPLELKMCRLRRHPGRRLSFSRDRWAARC